MNIFEVELSLNEIQLLRQSLDIISISGKDAKFVATLQVKLEREMAQIQEILKQEEAKKQKELQETLAREEKKSSKQ
jgi:hypothetical protein